MKSSEKNPAESQLTLLDLSGSPRGRTSSPQELGQTKWEPPSGRSLTLAPPVSSTPLDLFEHPPPDKVIDQVGANRAISGQLVEDLMIRMLDLTPVVSNGNYEVVYDGFQSGTYFEIKSLRCGSKCPVYDWRMKKDLVAQQQHGFDLFYVFAIHTARKGLKSIREWHEELARTLTRILVVPANRVRDIALDQPHCEIKSTAIKASPRAGYHRAGYRDGYRSVPYPLLRQGARAIGSSCIRLPGLDFRARILLRS